MTGTRGPLNAFLDVPQVPVPSAQSGLLNGLKLGVKDIFDVAGYRTGCGNPDKFAEAQTADAHDAGGPGDSRPGRAIRRQDPDRRARLFDDGHQCAFSGAGEFRRAGPRHRRLVMRIGGRRRRRAGQHRGRLGHRRLDPRPGEFLRADRTCAPRMAAFRSKEPCRSRPHSTRSAGLPTTSRPTRRSAASCSAATTIAASSIGRSPWRGWTRW